MDITFFGAAREVTGSCHLVRVGDSSVALDFGMFQGRRSESRSKNVDIPFALEKLERRRAVARAHRPLGAAAVAGATRLSRTDLRDAGDARLCAIMLSRLGAHPGKGRRVSRAHGTAVEPPLYDVKDVAKVMSQMICIPYDKPFDVAPGVRATFVDAGHILGSASVVLDCTEGDIRRDSCSRPTSGAGDCRSSAIRSRPEGADVVIMESTYGNRDHEPVAATPEQLAQIVRETAAQRRARPHSGVRRRSHAGAAVRSAPADVREGRFRRFRSSSTARWRSLRPRCSRRTRRSSTGARICQCGRRSVRLQRLEFTREPRRRRRSTRAAAP